MAKTWTPSVQKCLSCECLKVFIFHKDLQPLWEEVIRSWITEFKWVPKVPARRPCMDEGANRGLTFPLTKFLALCWFARRCLRLAANLGSWFFIVLQFPLSNLGCLRIFFFHAFADLNHRGRDAIREDFFSSQRPVVQTAPFLERCRGKSSCWVTRCSSAICYASTSEASEPRLALPLMAAAIGKPNSFH